MIRCLVLDVDGVLTDGRLWYGLGAEPLRAFHIHDGLAIMCFRQTLGEVVILTAKQSEAVRIRADELGIRHVIQGSRDKWADLERRLPDLGVAAEQIAAMGDDLPDLAVLRRVGYPMAPANAVAEVKAAARFVTTRAGGRGAVREAVEHLMRQAGQWDSVLSGYDAVALSTSEVKRGTAQ
jgi:3-deoxy-D-manno-octulosonate 8-phosphate phosphatase (KDO 8-P phosphatase)